MANDEVGVWILRIAGARAAIDVLPSVASSTMEGGCIMCMSSIHDNRYQFHFIKGQYIIDMDTTQERVRCPSLGNILPGLLPNLLSFQKSGGEREASSAFKTLRKPKWKKDTHSYAILLFLAPCQGQLSAPTKEELDLLEHCICITLCGIIDVWIIEQVLNPEEDLPPDISAHSLLYVEKGHGPA